MNKLPITLCVITRNSQDRIEKVIKKHEHIVSEIIVVDQNSTDKTAERARKAGAFTTQRRTKGTSDPDRNWTFNLAKNPWVLYLDDDEWLDIKYEEIAKLLDINVDAVWFPRKNLVDGVDVKKILGEDFQCRLFKKGATQWSDAIHTYPQPAPGVKVIFSDKEIVHERSLEGLKKSNRTRNAIATPQQVKAQESFIQGVEEILSTGIRPAQ